MCEYRIIEGVEVEEAMAKSQTKVLPFSVLTGQKNSVQSRNITVPAYICNVSENIHVGHISREISIHHLESFFLLLILALQSIT